MGEGKFLNFWIFIIFWTGSGLGRPTGNVRVASKRWTRTTSHFEVIDFTVNFGARHFFTSFFYMAKVRVALLHTWRGRITPEAWSKRQQCWDLPSQTNLCIIVQSHMNKNIRPMWQHRDTCEKNVVTCVHMRFIQIDVWFFVRASNRPITNGTEYSTELPEFFIKTA